jgi:hypothetical protein
MYRSSQALLLGLLLGVWPVVDLGLSERPGLAQGVEQRKVENSKTRTTLQGSELWTTASFLVTLCNGG